MNNQSNPLSLPTRQPARTDSLSIRLSPEERGAVESLAKQLRVPTSHMARHFLMQAVTFYSARTPEPEEA